MFIIVGIPVMVILVMLLAAAALAVQVAPIILFCIKILFIAGYWFFGICAYLSRPNRKENSSFSFVLAIIGHCIGGVITYYFFDVVENVKTIIIFLLINFIIMFFSAGGKKVIYLWNGLDMYLIISMKKRLSMKNTF